MDRIPPAGSPVSDPLASWLRTVPAGPPPEAPCPDDGVLLAWQDGRLADDVAASTDRHLAACAECRALVRELAVPVPETLVDALVELTPERRRRGWPVLVAAALAASFMWLVLPAGDVRVPAYDLQGPYGGEQLTRTVAESRVFGPQSRLRVLLRPSADLQGTAPTLRAFVVGRDGELSGVPASALTSGFGGAWRLDAAAADLFPAPGPYTVHLALAVDAASLDALAGQTPTTARDATPDARWLSFTVEYRHE